MAGELMATIGEELEQFKRDYTNGSVVTKYILYTLALMENFKAEQKVKWLRTQPEISREEYLKAIGGN